jgi:hypothetical protein
MTFGLQRGPKCTPASVQNRFGLGRFRKGSGIRVANEDGTISSHKPGAKFVLETVPPVGDPRVDCLDPAFLLARCAIATFSSTARLNGCASTAAPSLLVANSLRPRSMSTDSLNRASYRVGWCLGVAYQRPRASSLMLAKSRWRSSGRNCPKPATTLCHTRSSYGHRQCQTP